uniref:Uncharacterized protein n=1 Tax=Kwoniella bestiolae CBS 10118 TaxID=1296100 RepID=A0A1B9FR25_9TREE|nr:hypothetical protein I302_08895 [Kwoniella bestiolae CBS 10118]OCF21223.1 hypothetical protein I302_08895 [Kwoniella bestiolae CBS 10118]
MDEITLTPTPTLGAIISVTSTLFDVISTSLGEGGGLEYDYPNGTSPFDVFDNSTISDPDIGTISDSEGSYVLNTFIGLLIVLVASVFNALGLNLTKLDHVKQQSIPKRQRKKEWMRILWLSGMGMYIASQVSDTLASWIATGPAVPSARLGSTAWQFFFGIQLLICTLASGDSLNSLWSRPSWLVYFLFIVLFTTSTYLVSSLFASLLASRASFSPLPSPTLELPTSRPKSDNAIFGFFKRISRTIKGIENVAVRRLEGMFARTDDARLIWLQGMGWAVTGGSLAGLCLVFTKSAVKLFGLPGHPLVHPSALITLLLVIVTAVLQIVCLDRALKCADTVVVVPLFYAGYTVFGFINSLIFYNETGQFARWVLVTVFISIAVLISGVVLLSLKSSAKAAPDPYTVSAQPSNSMRLRPRNHARTQSGVTDHEAGPSGKHDEDDVDALSNGEVEPRDVLWEVGSVSDTSDDEEKESKAKGKGVGGMRGGTGERRGLLGDEEEDAHEGEDRHSKKEKENPFVRKGEEDEEEDDGFGEYEGVEHGELRSGESTPKERNGR